MGYIIDGHNLIPKIPGLNLRQMDDEMNLIQVLQAFCGLKQKNARVFFDGAPPGYHGRQPFGRVTAYFVRQGMTADEAIREHLQSLGKAAKNWQVVSSDRQVTAEARSMGAGVISSSLFARQITASGQQRPASATAQDERLSEDEIEDWMQFFGVNDEE